MTMTMDRNHRIHKARLQNKNELGNTAILIHVVIFFIHSFIHLYGFHSFGINFSFFFF